MHTETQTSAFEQYIAAHRPRIAVLLALVLMIVLNTAWVFVSAAIHVSSTHLDMAVFALSAMGAGITALAFYWSAE